MGQRRRRDPLKLVCADKINRCESFCRRHWPFTVCVCVCVCPGVPGCARTVSVQMPFKLQTNK